MSYSYLILFWILSSFTLANLWAQVPHQVRLYDSRNDALQGRISVIKNDKAQKIYISAFIFADDEVGLLHAQHLISQAEKGKEVKLLIDGTNLIDGFGSKKISQELLFLLVDAGVEVGIYRGPKLKHLKDMNNRLHDKLIINDAGELITGGANTKNSYFDLDKVSLNHVEYEAYVHGRAATDAREYFESVFADSAVDKLKTTDLKVDLQKLDLKIDQIKGIEDHFDQMGLVPKNQLYPNLSRSVQAEHVSFVAHGLKAHNQSPIAQTLKNFVKNTQSSLTMDAQYLIPTKEFYEALGSALAENSNLQVSMVTNGPQAMELKGNLNIEPFNKRNILVLAYESELTALSELGSTTNVWEYNGHGKIHSKAIVSDKSKVLIWTANMDNRSFNMNLEVGVEIHSPVIAEKLEEKIKAHMHTSIPVVKNGVVKKKICHNFFDELFVKLLKRYL